MNIQEYFKNLNIIDKIINNDGYFTNIAFDSREVSSNYLFVATKGTNVDSHLFIDASIASGARVIVCESKPNKINPDITYIIVKDSQEALGILASAYYNDPSSKLKLIGVTGTNGKTTIASSLYNLIRKLGYKCGLISTIQIKIEEMSFPSTHTTPNPLELNKYLAMMVEHNCEYCFMEVSSHAVVQKRIAGLKFEGGLFTNLTHDHLDFHKTFKEYIRAKQMFFDSLSSTAFALSNHDDKNGEFVVQNTKAHKYYYSLFSLSDFKGQIIENHFDGMLLKINNLDVWTKFCGRFNAYNLLCIYACAKLCGFEDLEILTNLSALNSVEGRFELLTSPNGVYVIVDYAHTPDALLNVLSTINEIVADNDSNVITVCGCGGDRDKTKRPEMAQIAVENSTKVIFTSDNPRSEDPEKILDDMVAGLSKIYNNNYLRIINRAEAIKTSLLLANKGDVVLIAGKGHEKYQEINGVKYHFDDKEIVNNNFNNL